MIDYSDILGYLEELVEEIDFEETTLIDIKAKLQHLISEIEDQVDDSGETYIEFNFEDLE